MNKIASFLTIFFLLGIIGCSNFKQVPDYASNDILTNDESIVVFRFMDGELKDEWRIFSPPPISFSILGPDNSEITLFSKGYIDDAKSGALQIKRVKKGAYIFYKAHQAMGNTSYTWTKFNLAFYAKGKGEVVYFGDIIMSYGTANLLLVNNFLTVKNLLKQQHPEIAEKLVWKPLIDIQLKK
ncbi:MAG: hypothetical protein LBO02_03790 [Holosporaceae bacterium]|jgi:hypothetical protein|nr:hypothetical protein [Holosporaceae bacterium]